MFTDAAIEDVTVSSATEHTVGFPDIASAAVEQCADTSIIPDN